MDHFGKIKSRLLLKGKALQNSFLIETFLSGLKKDIKLMVMAFKPNKLADAYEVAYFMESVSEGQMKRLKASYRNTSTTMALPVVKSSQERLKLLGSRPVAVIVNARNTLMDQRRALGLCFKYGEKYFSGHQYKVNVQMLVGQDSVLKIEESEHYKVELV